MSQYEFSSVENETIAAAGARARTWAVLSIIFGALQLLLGVATLGKGGLTSIGYLVGAPVSVVVGVTILGVASALRSAVDTRGNDIGHVMQALKKLGTAYTIQIAVIVAGFSAGMIAGAMGLR
jgi:hypothetical protein